MSTSAVTRRVRRSLRVVAMIVVGSFCTISNAQDHPTPTRPPNIVFFLADDAGPRDFGAFGQDLIKTPNIDKLAGEGVKLSTHYTGNSVCAPSRCVLLTGKHPGRVTVRDNAKPANYKRGTIDEGQYPVAEGELKFPLTLKEIGYTSGGFGKWGLGPFSSTGSPLKQGFDHFTGYICQTVAHNYYPGWIWEDGKQIFLNNPEARLDNRFPDGLDPTDPANYRKYQGTQYAPDLYTEAALKFVRDNKDKPFFLYYPTIAPHGGYQVPEDSLSQYEGKFPEEPSRGNAGSVPVRNPRAAYAALLTRMDREIGRIIAQVNELGLENDTIFVFTSDNGGTRSSPGVFFNSAGNFRGSKGSIYDGAFRTAGIVKWKGRIAPGRTIERVTGFEDWFPTLVDLAGHSAKLPKDLDGISFAPTLLGQTQEPRPFLYREFPDRGQFVRVGNWKAIRSSGERVRSTTQPGAATPVRGYAGAPDPAVTTPKTPGEIELYNLALDPSEQNDVAGQNPEIVAQLDALLKSQHTPSDVFPLKVVGESKISSTRLTP